MKSLRLIALVAITLAVATTASSAVAATGLSAVATTSPKAKTSAQTPPVKKSTLSREVVFDGASVDGKYHSAGEGVAQVEKEKRLNRLIGVRRNFRDRLGAEQQRLERTESK